MYSVIVGGGKHAKGGHFECEIVPILAVASTFRSSSLFNKSDCKEIYIYIYLSIEKLRLFPSHLKESDSRAPFAKFPKIVTVLNKAMLVAVHF